MRNLILFILILSFHYTSAQYNQDAPWMKSLDIENKMLKSNDPENNKTVITFKATQDAFNNYWKNRDHTLKGSGYKPFKRWEDHWKNFVNKNNKLPSSSVLYKSWLEASKFNKANRMTDDSDWQPLGPFSHTNTGSWSSGQGRVNVVFVDPNNAINNTNIVYVGVPAGGIWKSTNGGTTWSNLSDYLPQIGVSGIAVEYGNANVIYIATGDDDNTDSFSVGVWKSIDGGLTWNPTGLNPDNSPTSMNDIYSHPTNPNILWVATNTGLYKTTDGGITWTNTHSGNIKDLKLKPRDPNTIYIATTTEVFKSTDGGDTFAPSSNGLPALSGRLVIDITPANPNVIYVFSVTTTWGIQGIYKSSDSGATFIEMDADGYSFGYSQAYYDMAFAVSDTDENEIYTGILNIWKSTDSGATMVRLNEWDNPTLANYTHADIHFLRFYNGELYAGTDGGFYKSSDGGTSFTDFTTGMQIGQFYRIAVSKQDSNYIVGGLQDNGGYGFNNGVWQNFYGDDGMDVAIDPANPKHYYGFNQLGQPVRFSNDAGASLTMTLNASVLGNWVTPLVINKDGEVYGAGSSLQRLTNNKFNAITPYMGGNIDVLEINYYNPDIIYLAVNQVLKKSTDRGVSFTDIATFSNDITAIESNNNNIDIVYVCTSGLLGNVFQSNDGGLNFNDITGGLPNVTKNTIKHQYESTNNTIYLGTSLGVYKYDDTNTDWEPFNTNLPNVSITDIEINSIDNNITVSTYGRGVWRSSLTSTPLANTDIKFLGVSGLNVSSVDCNSMVSPQLEFENNGLSTINRIDITYSIDGVSRNYVWNGTLTSKNKALVSLPDEILNEGVHTFFMSAQVLNDEYITNNESLTISFRVNQSEVVQNSNDFESSSEQLVTYNSNISETKPVWERGIPTGNDLNTASSGTQVYGTTLNGDSHPDSKGYLVSKCYDLSEIDNPVLKFYMAYELYESVLISYYDVLYIEYSLDEGTTWRLLGSSSDTNWYNSAETHASNVCKTCVGGQWIGVNTSMQQYSYDLSALTAETSFVFRFVFHTDYTSRESEGVIIDDLLIDGTPALSTDTLPLSQFVVYPNPSPNIFNINISNIPYEYIKYKVVDITGKTVISTQEAEVTENTFKLNMVDFTSGLYFLNIETNLGHIVKKIILN